MFILELIRVGDISAKAAIQHMVAGRIKLRWKSLAEMRF
jgi:hypothetical protein